MGYRGNAAISYSFVLEENSRQLHQMSYGHCHLEGVLAADRVLVYLSPYQRTSFLCLERNICLEHNRCPWQLLCAMYSRWLMFEEAHPIATKTNCLGSTFCTNDAFTWIQYMPS